MRLSGIYALVTGKWASFDSCCCSAFTQDNFFTPDGVLIAISAFTGSTDLDDGGAIDNSIYVDVNGSKRPNQYGKDMFVLFVPKGDNAIWLL